MRRTPLISAIWRVGGKQKIDNQQHNADVNGRIGDIKNKEVTAKRMQIEIINDGAVNNPVDRIAKGAPDDQSER
jgi:hypothetical protein